MKLKRIFSVLAAAAMLCCTTACGSSGSSSDSSGGTAGNSGNGMPVSPGVLRGAENLSIGSASHSPADTEKNYKVGIIKLMDHAALNLSEEGFVAALTDAGFVIGENLLLEYRNGDGDEAKLNEIADEFIANNDDLIFAIATPAAQACAKKTTKVSIIGTAITDFVDAGLVQSNARPGTNVSGTTDMSPIDEQINLMLDIFPDIGTIGFVYTASESNSAVQIATADKYAKSRGLNVVEKTVNSKEDIEGAFSEIVSQCDAIYLPTDNLIAANIPIVAGVCNSAKIPVFCAESGMVEAGGFGTLGIDYYDLGYQAGLMAVKVLDGTSIDRMSIQKSTKYEYCFNRTAVEALGITLPEKYREYII